jgi:TRAP transporter 4TM/12TM fusion protein
VAEDLNKEELVKKMTAALEEEEEVEKKVSGRREYKGPMAWFVRGFSAMVVLYAVFFATNICGRYLNTVFVDPAYLGLFLFSVLTLVFLLFPATKKAPRDRLPWYDLLLILISLAPTLHEFLIARDLLEGVKLGATILDQVFFIVLLVVLLEAIRRTTGWAVMGVIIVGLAYAYFAFLLPGLWGAPRFSLQNLAEYMYLYPSGIFGMILGIAGTIIILYVTFGAFLVASGVGKLLVNCALAVAGKYRGGPAKVTIVGSALFGMMSGSPTASVGTIGAITIPMMKNLGYKPYFAGAVESVVATGSVLTPPVMGSIAFIMADLTGLGYGAVCLAAILPCILYYLCLFFQIDFEAAKLGLAGMPPEQIPSLKNELKKSWQLLLPVIVLIVLLMMDFPTLEAPLYAVLAVILVSWFRKETRLGFRKILDALASGTNGVLMIAPVMAAIGVIFGALTLTGLSINLSRLIRDVAGNNLWLLAILVWVFMYIAGMGVGEQITYIAMALIVGTAFVDLGVPVLAAHMFIFIAGLSMFITPPNCPAVFVASAIAGSGMWRTAFQAMKLGITAFLIPFPLLYNPTLILYGKPGEIILTFIACAIAVYFIGAGIEGYMFRRATLWQRILFIVGGLVLFFPSWQTDVAAAPVLFVPALAQFISWRKAKKPGHLKSVAGVLPNG